MSLNMTIKEFEELNLFSNKNVEKIATAVVNESDNAALVSMFEDNVILLDHNTGNFYTAGYNFDGDDLKLTLENFELIELEKEESSFKTEARNFFESEDFSLSDLTESYKESIIGQEKFVNDIVSEALATKDFEGAVDYTELAENNKDLSILDEPFFEAYKQRIETHPLTEAKHFNWEDKVVVSLVETEAIALINSSVKEKASDLWKNTDFKEAFTEAALEFVEDVEEGTEKLVGLLEEFPQIFFLDKGDRNSLFGKTIISNKDLRENKTDLTAGLNAIFESNGVLDLQESYLAEADETDETEGEKDETPAKELTGEQISTIAKSLKGVAEKVEDEKLKEKLDGIVAKLDKSLDEGTRPDLIKEAVQLLTL